MSNLEDQKLTIFPNKVIKVTDPIKHGEGSQAFVSYLISSDFQVRRRFQDFILLYKFLHEAYPASIIPPLPGKAHMTYISGDRFSSEFLEKRTVGLQTFIDRVARHPILGNSPEFEKFLSADQMALVDPTIKRDATVLDNLTEGLINVFTKVKQPDEKFVAIRDSIEKLESNLGSIEKFHNRMLKAQLELATSFKELGSAMESLGSMETQIQEPLLKFGEMMPAYATLIKEKVSTEDLDYTTPLHQYVNYCSSARETLKLRDQKQVDHEELNRFLTESANERDKTKSTGKSPGISGFFKDKINDFKGGIFYNFRHHIFIDLGVDPEKARQMRLAKLEGKIEELEQAVSNSEETHKHFSSQVLQDVELFNRGKLLDFKELFRELTDAQLEFHEKGTGFWRDLVTVVDELKLNDDHILS